jgi:hypothetical protein
MAAVASATDQKETECCLRFVIVCGTYAAIALVRNLAAGHLRGTVYVVDYQFDNSCRSAPVVTCPSIARRNSVGLSAFENASFSVTRPL